MNWIKAFQHRPLLATNLVLALLLSYCASSDPNKANSDASTPEDSGQQGDLEDSASGDVDAADVYDRSDIPNTRDDGAVEADGGIDAGELSVCRTYATETVVSESTFSDTAAGVTTICTYDATESTMTCVPSAPLSDQTAYSFLYESNSDFVRESQVLGLKLYVEGAATNYYPAQYIYDPEGRLQSESIDRDDDGVFTDMVFTFDQWDEKGRPLSGEINFYEGTCTNIICRFEYDDKNRKITETADFSEAIGCGDNSYSAVQSFDKNGNRIGFELSQDGETSRIVWEVTQTERFCESQS